EILNNLLTSVDAVEELEYINGRYFIIIHNTEGTHLYSDASQLRPLVYHRSSKVLASHDVMLKDLLSDYGVHLERRSKFNHNELTSLDSMIFSNSIPVSR